MLEPKYWIKNRTFQSKIERSTHKSTIVWIKEYWFNCKWEGKIWFKILGIQGYFQTFISRPFPIFMKISSFIASRV